MEITEALERLQNGHILICIENRILIGLKNKKIFYGMRNGIHEFLSKILYLYFVTIHLLYMKMKQVLTWKKMMNIMLGETDIYRMVKYVRDCI